MGLSEHPGSFREVGRIENQVVKKEKEKSSFFSPVIDVIKSKIDDIFKLSERKAMQVKHDYLEQLRSTGESNLDDESKQILRGIFIGGNEIDDYQLHQMYDTDIRGSINTYYSAKVIPIINSLITKTEGLEKHIVSCEFSSDYDEIDLSDYISYEDELLIHDVLKASAAGNQALYDFEKFLNRLGYEYSDFNIKHIKNRSSNNQVKNSIQKEIDKLN